MWLAEDEHLGIQVAVKQIDVPPGLPEEEIRQSVSRARSEARNAVQLRGHPNVANVLDVVEHDGLPWIVMEYVTGATDLRTVIRERGRLEDADIARVGVAVLKALSAGHSLGIVHRDVKPANILLAPDHSGNRYGRIMLTDYGISLHPGAGQTRMTNGVIGTPGYMAPERAQGAEPPASDLFSLGVTLYCASEGQGPFDRDHPAAAIAASITAEPERPSHASGPLADVVMSLLAKQAGQRSTAHTAITALQAVEATERAAPSGLSISTRRQTVLRLSPRRIAGAAVGVVAVLAGTAWAAIEMSGMLRDDPGTSVPPKTSGTNGTGSASPGQDESAAGAGSGPDRVSILYGSDVGLDKPLKAGECVIVGTHTKDYTALSDVVVVDCEADEPIPAGQVMVTVPNAAEAAVRHECSRQTAALRAGLADPVLVALRPNEQAASDTAAKAACLVFQRGIKTGGPLGKYRIGTTNTFISQMSVGDCYKAVPGEDFFLVDCNKPHEDQVIGHVPVRQEVAYTALDTEAVCMNRFEQDWVRTDRQEIVGYVNEEDWESGFHVVTCTLAGKDGSELPTGTAKPK